MKQVIRLTEKDIKNMVEHAIYEAYNKGVIDEGKLGKALGTAALGGALMFGGHNAAAQNQNTAAYTQQASMPQSNNGSSTLDVGEYSNAYAEVKQDTVAVQKQIPQDKLGDRIINAIQSKIESDDIMKQITANYELIYECGIDAQTMYKNLMTKLYANEEVKVNEGEGVYQITVTEEETGREEDRTIYKIFLKDGKFKITAYLRSKTAYKWWGFGGSNVLSESIINLPKFCVSAWACTIIEGSKDDFDF